MLIFNMLSVDTPLDEDEQQYLKTGPRMIHVCILLV